ncbi:hypothetical protein PCIT_a1743 [Pseudoalteromonas citrea]|uniref:Uncharacterized protein n=1 Tax=Pseudoalteromonas citrea TaxID=43655 RepID=A0AAD4AMM9_9GAMM|nr:hypothetical protein PCIT_a1743 [Pseudoalteromonas citrea]
MLLRRLNTFNNPIKITYSMQSQADIKKTRLVRVFYILKLSLLDHA